MADPSRLTGDPNSHDLSKFSTSLSSTCLCKSIRVTINDNELFTRPRGHLCHCANCRKVSGSYVSSNLAIEREKVVVDDPKGVMKKYIDWETNSGNKVERFFCGTCGNPIMSLPDVLPTLVIVKMGMFPRIPQPECESFALHRHPWQGKHEGLTQFEIVKGGKKLGE
ncbi:hypothetical protein BU25DRAFT_211743 [Macroventuria anomochaeta]|uniref:Uncharacterized protein n=1 Tax=Macroventuria anomochaeta TaxID=301207 RepID=A0ACB6RKW6_9PLEO|nr:uncharacterized protein BU25DRAFT_211743 [Macroventuria anomochaeta]KAF2622378.1 hypothetical protein BU25DRAFT_211743 [Macroventuria anomochaeta]